MNKILEPDKIQEWLKSWWNRELYDADTFGIGDDDCAIISLGEFKLVITMDFLNANPIIIELGIGSFEQLGYLLVCANLSDLAGTGAKPIGFISGAMMKRSSQLVDFKNLMKGIKKALIEYNVPLLGGDTKLGNSLVLNGVALGIEEKGSKLFPHSGAVIGDDIWVSGEIGNVAGAINFFNIKRVNEKLEKWCVEVLNTPKVPLIKSLMISDDKLGNGGTDLSDGLSADLYDICRSSNVGAKIYCDLIPVANELVEIAKINNVKPWVYGLVLGGDCQFIVTAKKENSLKMKKIGMTKIGEIIKSKKVILKLENKNYEMPKIGHEDGRRMTFTEELEFMCNQFNFIQND